jgi:hypothetical protein
VPCYRNFTLIVPARGGSTSLVARRGNFCTGGLSPRPGGTPPCAMEFCIIGDGQRSWRSTTRHRPKPANGHLTHRGPSSNRSSFSKSGLIVGDEFGPAALVAPAWRPLRGLRGFQAWYPRTRGLGPMPVVEEDETEQSQGEEGGETRSDVSAVRMLGSNPLCRSAENHLALWKQDAEGHSRPPPRGAGSHRALRPSISFPRHCVTRATRP